MGGEGGLRRCGHLRMGCEVTLSFFFVCLYVLFCADPWMTGSSERACSLSGHGCLVWVTFFFCTFYVPPVLLCRASIWGRWPPVLRIGLWPLFDGYFSVWAFLCLLCVLCETWVFPNFNKDALCGKVKWNYPLCSLLAFSWNFWHLLVLRKGCFLRHGGGNFPGAYLYNISVSSFKEFVYYIQFYTLSGS